jgi:hypothetical protein
MEGLDRTHITYGVDKSPQMRFFFICTIRSSINDSDLTVINYLVHQKSCLNFPTAVVISLNRYDFHAEISTRK